MIESVVDLFAIRELSEVNASDLGYHEFWNQILDCRMYVSILTVKTIGQQTFEFVDQILTKHHDNPVKLMNKCNSFTNLNVGLLTPLKACKSTPSVSASRSLSTLCSRSRCRAARTPACSR